MKKTLSACLVGLALAASAAGPAGAQRPSQPERKADGQKRRQPRLYARKAGVEVPARPLLSRMEKLAHPKDESKPFDFKVEVVDVGGLDVVSKRISDDFKQLVITVRNNGAVTPKENPHLAVYVFYYKLYGSGSFNPPIPVFDFIDTAEMPALKPNEEFVYRLDLAKKGVVLFDPNKAYDLKDGYPKISVECYIVSGSFGFKL